MPVDYSKWDALELSDDSDIEVHPNVDKRSFIRAKQNQIHQQRVDRKHRITTLKYERVVNDGLLSRMHALQTSLESHKADAEATSSADDIDEIIFDALTEVNADGSLGHDQPPLPPAGVHSKEQQPSYSKMMGSLVDQVKAEIDKRNIEPSQRFPAFIVEVKSHWSKVQGLQKDLNTELSTLEKEDAGKITSESIHTGFDSSHVAKSNPATAAMATKAPTSSEPQLLNPSASQSGGGASGAEADIEDGALSAAPGEEDEPEASPAGKKFGRIPLGDYRASLQFISEHPQILSERESDGLLAEAFTAQMSATNKKEEEYARQCVHQAILLQYCRQLGKDGVGLFFKRIQTQNHQARKLFLDDVNNTYARIRSRTAELAKLKEEEGDGDREQIQLHAVDPGTKINIITPPPMEQCENDDERGAREIFDTFPPGLQRALESGSLDRVNEILGKMSVDEAEQVVEQLGNGGMLSLQGGVIDATTDEGKKQVEDIEKTHKLPGDTPENNESRIVEIDEMD